MNFLRTMILLGFAAHLTSGQETTSLKEDKAAVARFQKALTDGKEFQLLKLTTLVKLEQNEIRCGDYFIRSYSLRKSTGQKAPTLLFSIDVFGDQSSMEFFRDQHLVIRDDRKLTPTVAIKKSNGGSNKITVRISGADLINAQPCLPNP